MIQIFKNNRLFKLLFLGAMILLSACTNIFDSLQKDAKITTEQKFVVAVMLPLSGKYESIGNGLLKAINMAYYDAKNGYLTLKIYDTKGDEKIAANLAKQAVKDEANIILGPLLSKETEAVRTAVAKDNILVMSFSNDVDNLVNNSNTFLMSYLPGSEVEAMITFAIKEKNSSNFAIIAPKNKYGETVIKSAEAAIKNHNLPPLKVVTYPPEEVKLATYLSTLVPKEELTKYRNLRKKLDNKEVVLDEKGVPYTKIPYPKLDFDTLIIADFGKRLNIVASHLPFIDIDYKTLQILGSGAWGAEATLKDNILQNAYYPSYPNVENNNLYNRFQKYYNRTPTLLEYGAYDAVFLLSSLVYMDEDDNLVSNFTKDHVLQYKGSNSILGGVAFREEGTNFRSVIINQIVNNKANQVSKIDVLEGVIKSQEIQP